MKILFIFCVIALIFLLAERLMPARPQRMFRSGLVTDGFYAVTSILIRFLVNGTLAVGISQIGQRYFPDYMVGVLLDKPLWVQAIAVVVVLDFFFYVMHRLKHRWTWWWRLHETHHSSRELDWFSSVRFHPVEKLLDRTIYLFPLLFLGVSEESLVILAATDALIASFCHANLNWRIGPLIYVFNGPEMHHWHHACGADRRDCNFGNNLSIFDWLFGTAYLSGDEPREFGVDDRDYPEGNIIRQFFYAFRPRHWPASSARQDGEAINAGSTGAESQPVSAPN
jgi:sterol desaturase/sphingolipid hydroxylase (fatty acid hydroxylase superfamily)